VDEPVLATAQVVQAGGTRVRLVHGLSRMVAGSRLCAPAFTCRCIPGDNLALHAAMARAPAGSALVCDAGGDVAWGYFGELMATDAVNRGISGLVIDGSVRDVDDIERLGLPVFARATAPAQAVKRKLASVGEPVELGGVAISPGDQVIADRDAIAVVAAADWPVVRDAAIEIARRESDVLERLRKGERLAGIIGLELPD
jgi:4-hydroxy-4-methyl-2-oxoglutarate aldolase